VKNPVDVFALALCLLDLIIHAVETRDQCPGQT